MQPRLFFTATTLCFALLANAQNTSPFWSLAGNNNAVAGSKLGTTNFIPLNLTTNNATRIKIFEDGRVGVGGQITGANATRVLNLADANAVMRILRVHATNAPAVELLSRTSADGPNVAYWDMYAEPSDKSFRIRDRIGGGAGLDRLTITNIGNLGIGTSTPDASSLLDIKSTTRGFLTPRMTQAQRDAIASPAIGLLVYQTNNTPGFYYYTGSTWTPVKSNSGSGGGWSLTGNAGTNPSANFIGTTDAHPLVFKVNNQRAGYIDYLNVPLSGAGNTALGYQTLVSNTGWGNTAMGYNALLSNTSGYDNTATGNGALLNNSTGSFNAAFGYNALSQNTTGSNNAAFGEGALGSNSTASNNTAIGERALSLNTSGHDNTASGNYALFFNTTGNYNTATGSFSFRYNSSGSFNTGTGYNALYTNSEGNYNTAIGYQTLYSNTTASNATASGAYALFSNTTGDGNTATGASALYSNTTGNLNTATGLGALYANTTGNNNTATGWGALSTNSNGYSNTATGVFSLNSNTTGFYNTGTGYSSLSLNQNGSYNTATGYGSLSSNEFGSNNTAVGYLALASNKDYHNTAVGYKALFTNVTGFNNTSIGIGADVAASNLINATAIGANAIVNATNKIRLGDGSITVVESSAGSWTVSDGRFKNDVTENVRGIEFIKLLKPVTYKFDTKKFEEFLVQAYPDSIKVKRIASNREAIAKASGIIQSGFIAQDMNEAAKKVGYNFNGIHAPESATDNWSISYEKLVVPLVKAVQELSQMNDDKDARINALVTRLEKIEALLKINSAVATLSDASLDQNIPNPFTNSTAINYFLPQSAVNAQIRIADIQGKTLKSITLSGSGRGTVNIDAGLLSAGAYTYSLYINNRLVSTKKMERLK